MTALEKYQRLECSGLWRSERTAQRRNVVVSLGDATLTISDKTDTALAHWSLPAVVRLNPGKRPALYAPGPDSAEMLELQDETVIGALNKLHRVIERRRPHHGRLRYALTGGFLAVLVGLMVFWLPGALVSYTVTVVPDVTRANIGQRLAERVHRVAGRACDETFGTRALQRLRNAVLGADSGTRLVILSDATQLSGHLPGGLILLNRSLVEEQNSPDPIAGFILAEDERARRTDPMLRLLRHAGIGATLKLLTTGDLADPVLDRYAEVVLSSPPAPVPDTDLLARFAAISLPSSPYAFALDPSGETTLGLIEADPVPPALARPPLSDGDWISLQGICID